MWMTAEFVDTVPSSSVHIGPPVPVGGISSSNINNMMIGKLVLFILAVTLQVVLYCGVYHNKILMPENEDEDQIIKNEAVLLFKGQRAYAKPMDSDSIVDIVDGFASASAQTINNSGLSLAYIENAYIIFWIMKDLFWAAATGDFSREEVPAAITIEALAISFGTLAILIYLFNSYLHRRHLVPLLDSISTIFWILANLVWMCGEFFLRYRNMTQDDGTEGNDSVTRLVACPLFLIGILIQTFVLFRFAIFGCNRCRSTPLLEKDLSTSSSSSSPAGSPKVSKVIEMLTLKAPIKYESILITFSPQHQHLEDASSPKSSNLANKKKKRRKESTLRKTASVDDDEESTILF